LGREKTLLKFRERKEKRGTSISKERISTNGLGGSTGYSNRGGGTTKGVVRKKERKREVSVSRVHKAIFVKRKKKRSGLSGSGKKRQIQCRTRKRETL